MSEYLTKFIARCGAAARRKAAELVKSGAVKVNGRVIYDPAFSVESASDEVIVNGNILQPPSENIYIMLNKPVGYTTSHSDRHAEHLAIELIDCPEAKRLLPAGRLDRDSEGLLIFSNDGDFIQLLAHPRYNICKLYKVTASIALNQAARQRMLNGIIDDNETLHALEVTELADEKNTYLFKLNEGKKREIRRMLKACGAATLKLQRIAMGNVKLGDLAIGKWRYLSDAEVKSLQKAAAACHQQASGSSNSNLR